MGWSPQRGKGRERRGGSSPLYSSGCKLAFSPKLMGSGHPNALLFHSESPLSRLLTSCTCSPATRTISRGRILSSFLLHRCHEEMKRTRNARLLARGPQLLKLSVRAEGDEFHRPETPPSTSPYRPDNLENPPLGRSLNSWQHKTVFLKNVTEQWSTATLYWEYWLWISSWSNNRHEARSGVRHNTHLDLLTLLGNLLDKGQTFFLLSTFHSTKPSW